MMDHHECHTDCIFEGTGRFCQQSDKDFLLEIEMCQVPRWTLSSYVSTATENMIEINPDILTEMPLLDIVVQAIPRMPEGNFANKHSFLNGANPD